MEPSRLASLCSLLLPALVSMTIALTLAVWEEISMKPERFTVGGRRLGKQLVLKIIQVVFPISKRARLLMSARFTLVNLY